MADNYIFFWKEDEDNGDFSNWSEHSIESNGVKFLTLEHYLMYSKAKLFGDDEIAEKIIKTKNPLYVKRLGRIVKNFNESIWAANRYQIMETGIKMKVEQNDDIKQLLLSTGSKIIVEASPYDTIWGIGMSKKNTNAIYEEKWKGLNLLGKAWMKIRSEYIN